MAKLTVKELEKLSSSDAGKRLSDEKSLFGVVKEREEGIAVLFRYRYRFDGKLRDYTCGTWPTHSLKEIREARDAARSILAQGKDPNDVRRLEKLEVQVREMEAIALAQSRLNQAESLQARIAVRDVYERWVTVELVRRKDGGKEVRRMFEKDVLPLLGEIAIEDIRKGHVTHVTDALLARGVNRMAKQIFSLMRQMFRFAVDRDILDSDPTAAIRKAKIGGRDTERDRVLSEDEIRELSRKIPAAALLKSSELVIWIVLSTCCRIGELLKAKWEHINFETGEWLIPAANSKNGKPHRVRLSEFALEKFCELRSINNQAASGRHSNEEVWCFPNRNNSDHVCVKTVTKQVGDRQRGNAEPMSRRSPFTKALELRGGPWVPHDLRRTGATMMTALGVIPEVAERCLNHTEQSRVKRTYQRYSYETEMQQAWMLLGKRLELLTQDDDSKIVLLPTRNKGIRSI
jgi:integrase